MSSSSSSPPPEYRVHFVELQNGYKRSFVDSLTPTNTVEEAIHAFVAKNSLDASQSASIKFIFAGKQLERHRSLAMYGVQKDSLIQVMIPQEKEEAEKPKEAACDAPKVLEDDE